MPRPISENMRRLLRLGATNSAIRAGRRELLKGRPRRVRKITLPRVTCLADKTPREGR